MDAVTIMDLMVEASDYKLVMHRDPHRNGSEGLWITMDGSVDFERFAELMLAKIDAIVRQSIGPDASMET